MRLWQWWRNLFRCPDGEKHEWEADQMSYEHAIGVGALFAPTTCLRCGAEG